MKNLISRLTEIRAFLEDAVDDLHRSNEDVAADYLEAARDELARAQLWLGRRIEEE